LNFFKITGLLKSKRHYLLSETFYLYESYTRTKIKGEAFSFQKKRKETETINAKSIIISGDRTIAGQNPLELCKKKAITE